MIFIPKDLSKVVKPSKVDLGKRFFEIESGKVKHLLSLLLTYTHSNVHYLLPCEVLQVRERVRMIAGATFPRQVGL